MSDEIFNKDEVQEENDNIYGSTDNEKEDETENKSSISADLIRGHINTIILRTLYERDKYGYEIINDIDAKSHGQYSMKQPTLYSALKRLESQGYIKAYWKTDNVTLGGRRKYFTLTESGKEITERNQAEWEYSRTVIDNLISDRSFDFSQPAPTPVDFKILKGSVSRVPVVHETNETDQTQKQQESVPNGESPASVTSETVSEPQVKTETVIFTDESPNNSDQSTQQTSNDQYTATSAYRQTEQQVIDREAERIIVEENMRREEERRRTHENYLKLISTPAREPEIKTKEDIAPCADGINTNELIYNNKPETERDYKNLINGIFNKANQTDRSAQRKKPTPVQSEKVYVKPQHVTQVTDKARADGLKVRTADRESGGKSAVATTFDFGATLFKCSSIVGVILLIVFAFSIIFKTQLNVSIAYPLVILAIALVQFIIFGTLALTGYGRNSAKPTTRGYISVSIIITIISILIICVVAFLLGIVGNVAAKIIIPCIVALNIPVFTFSFYLLTK